MSKKDKIKNIDMDDLKALPVGTRLRSGEVLLEVTQIGKKCHSGCEIYKIMGDCIMPREGIFTRVLHGGVLTEGDEIVIEKAAGEADGGGYWCECGTFDNL